MTQLRNGKALRPTLVALAAMVIPGSLLWTYMESRARARYEAQHLTVLAQREQAAFDQLTRAENGARDLGALVMLCDEYLRQFQGSEHAATVNERRTAYLRRIDERDIDLARDYSAGHPLDFKMRSEHYRHYLDQHPAGSFIVEARTALRDIEANWDKNDFRAIRDLFLEQPGNLVEIVSRCREYHAAHANGRFRGAAADLLRWTERISAAGEYRVVLKSGHFDKKIAHFFSRGPDLSVELEVGGARYGPSNIVVNAYDPEWNYEFPRRIRWKLGDPVRIRVSDHDYWDRVVVDISSAEGDPLSIGILAGDAWCGKNCVTFASDFTWPVLPSIE